MNALHELLLTGAADSDAPETLAVAGIISLSDQRLPGYQMPIVGLSGPEFRRLLERFFPALDWKRATNRLPLVTYPAYTPGPGDEFPDLLELLLEHCTHSSEEGRWLAYTVATGCMGRNHLWQDLGLPNRSMLSDLLRTHFHNLFVRNVGDMKWKKFFYKQLCEKAEINLCRAPSCGVCCDYAVCFGQERGVPLVAVSGKLWLMRAVDGDSESTPANRGA